MTAALHTRVLFFLWWHPLRPVCCVGSILTFTEQYLNAVMQLLFAVKASLSRVVRSTIVRVPYSVKPQGTGSTNPSAPRTHHPLHHRHNSHSRSSPIRRHGKSP
ncbi:unnamed protein product [Pleuronectes platessa]|uniref:Secreted protein n=1 Tax=Pleuronectes platessa TaxID=8262 RepID=A0A9N7UI74_PLEPL|nr:unnamed protein product [Pleuronectes platessa]